MILSDSEIRSRAQYNKMIDPFIDHQVSKDSHDNKVISYGLASYGYDMRLGYEFKVFTNINNTIIDPKNVVAESFINKQVDEFLILPPNSFTLATSLEHFIIPRDILAICLGKSSLARCGLILNVTPLEPEWEGYVTIEISNSTTLPAKLYAGEGIAQIIFLKSSSVCETSYKDKGGKYQNQVGVTLPK